MKEKREKRKLKKWVKVTLLLILSSIIYILLAYFGKYASKSELVVLLLCEGWSALFFGIPTIAYFWLVPEEEF